jgi:hypothetical protein
MRGAAQAAQKAGASSLREYAEASRLGREAQDLHQRKQYTEATQKALEAQKRYEMARVAKAEMAKAAAVPATTPAPPTTLAAAVTLPTAPPTLPPVTAPPVTAAPAVTLPAGPSDDVLVRRAISAFGRAIENKDLAAYKALRPGLSREDEGKLRAAFDNIRSQEVELAIESVSIEGSQAVVRVVRSGKVNGQPVPTRRETYRLTKGQGAWSIKDIGQ